MRHRLTSSILLIAAAFCVIPAAAQTAATSVTGAGAAAFSTAAVLYNVSLSTMRFGIGVEIAGDGTASGDFQSTLLGAQGRRIVVEGAASSGSSALTGPTFAGTCSVDLGDGAAPLTGVPFTVAVAKAADGTSAITLVVGGTSLPAAPLTNGTVSVQ